jgi:hypothetical protein
MLWMVGNGSRVRGSILIILETILEADNLLLVRVSREVDLRMLVFL